MSDILAALKPAELATWYRRLADAVDRNRGDLKVSLAALLLRHWLDNRDPSSSFIFDAPDHVWNHSLLREAWEFHRRVFLSEEQARFTGGLKKWAGVIPRLLGHPPFPKWDGSMPLSMDYSSLVETPLRYQLTGDKADKDLLTSLRGFQLKTTVVLTATSLRKGDRWKINFQSFQSKILDRYDFDYKEHFTVANPDYGSKAQTAVEPALNKITVYHTNAKRLEDAALAAPYDVESRPRQVADARLMGAAEVEARLP